MTQTNECIDKTLSKKEMELFLYKFGKYHSEHVIAEVDALLKKHPDIEVPEGLDRWFDDYMRTLNKPIPIFRDKLLFMSKKSRRIAILCLCLILSFSLISLFSEANGYNLFKLFVQDEARYSQITFEDAHMVTDVEDYLSSLPEDWADFYYPTQLPTGYFFYDTMGANETKFIIFSNENDEHLVFSQDTLTVSAQIDTENALVEEIQINGLNGIASQKPDVTILVWHDNTNSFFMTGNLNLETMLKVAESVAYKNHAGR